MKLAYSMSGQVLRDWYNEDAHEELIETLRDDYDGIELYLGNDRNVTEKDGFFDIAEEAGIDVLSVHAPSLKHLHKEHGDRELAGSVNEYFTEYDDNGDRHKIRDLEQVTLHPSQKEGVPTQEDWENVVYNSALASHSLKSWGHPQAASIENCARYDPRYIITEAADVQALTDTADSSRIVDEVGVPINMTLDPGHSPDHSYKQMIDTVQDSRNVEFSSVHLHDKIRTEDTEARDSIRERFDIPGEWEIGTEDWDGELDHIPPGLGDIDMSEVGRVIDEDTLVTVELHPIYTQRPEALAYSADFARKNL